MPTRTPEKLSVNSAGNIAWTNMPSALTELLGTVHRRMRVDLTDVDKVRLTVRVSTQGFNNAVLRAEYSLNETDWVTLSPDVSISSVGTVASAWGLVPSEAKGDVVVRVVVVNGNGTIDPVFGNIVLELA
jgi:hypothetical protein